MLPSNGKSWRELLDDYKNLIVNSNVPMFMACGSHQFLAFAFKDWSAVGHIRDPNSSNPQVRISDEQDGGLIPSPRWQERGTLGIATTPDPLFAGLDAGPEGGLYYVDEEHYDEVIDGAYDTTKFQPIATYSLDLTPHYYSYGGSSHQTRSVVQVLKYVYPSPTNPDRVLYSSQFHPEADATTIILANPSSQGEAAQQAANTTGVTIIKNFLAQAQAFW